MVDRNTLLENNFRCIAISLIIEMFFQVVVDGSNWCLASIRGGLGWIKKLDLVFYLYEISISINNYPMLAFVDIIN